MPSSVLDALDTCTPARCVSAGRVLVTVCTRLLTLIVAWSGSVPMSKLAVSDRLPSLTLDCRNSRWSTPLTARSSGSATVCATLAASAPG